ncbi:MAG: D-sedoheptulose-7-phosphate isomerase [Planctomycetota bacterium]
METVIRKRIAEHAAALARLDDAQVATLTAAARLLDATLAAGGRLYVCGNGGSAADAQHIAGELVGRYLRERQALPCVALNADTAILTCLGNDYRFDYIYARQVEAFATSGDLLWVLSTSGNSPNILAAVEAARARGARVLGFTGGDGGKLAPLADVCFIAPATGSFAIQQLHQVAYHVLCELVEAAAVEREG